MSSTSFPVSPGDWRGVFISHLTHALSRRPDIDLSVWCPPGEMPGEVSQVMTAGDRAWLAGLMEAGGIAHQMRNGGFRGKLRLVGLLLRLRRMYRRERNVDIRHVNWLQNSLPLPADDTPLLVTVLGTDMKLLELPGMAMMLRRVFRRRPTVICPNAQWMVEPLGRHFGELACIRYVPFGIDHDWYSVDRTAVAGRHWLCVSRVTRAKIGTLFDWFQPLAVRGHRLTLVGPMQEEMTLPDWVDFRGPQSAPALLGQFFPRVTGLITLSAHAEGRPQVMLEAMAAGLPVLASAIPAHEDLLLDGVTGFVCRSADHLGEIVTRLDDAALASQVGAAARQWVKTHVGTWTDCARRYAFLYGKLLEGHHGHG